MHFPRNRYSLIAMLHDLGMAGASLWLAHYLRLGDQMMAFSGHYLWPASFGFVLTAGLVFVASGLYRGLWRYASMQDLLTLTRAAALALLIFYSGLFLLLRLEGVPRSVPVIHWLLLVAMLGGPRFAYRWAKDRRLGLDFTLAGPPKVPVLLIGATDAAELFIRESHRNPQAPYHVVGLTDDDPARRGQQLHGVRIYGGSDVLPRIVAKLERKGRRPQRAVLAESRPGGERVRELLKTCEKLGLPLSRLPQTLELQSGSGEGTEVRPIAVEDLLRRAQNVQDRSGMEALVAGKTVLVTGAGGTIGSELARQLAGFAPKRLILYEQAEYALYQIECELADRQASPEVVPLLGDVRDTVQLDKVFAAHRPQLIFHAAARKHVPLAEINAVETIATNALGTLNVAEAAKKHGAEAMVLISTDKAVHPANVMGASKRLAEKIVQAMAAEGGATRFLAVRFGNVLGSTGSVVPRFQAQLEAGGPLTVTHPDMTRYFMTVREAVELVIQAATLRDKGDGTRDTPPTPYPVSLAPLYILDMGEPVKIDDLARQMIRLAGLSETQIAIEYTGLRAGEKLHEELAYAEERLQPTEHAAIRRTQPQDVAFNPLQKTLKQLARACAAHDTETALALLRDAAA